MIDIHTHILPNFDDGSKSLEESRECLFALKNNGVNKVILTPHFYVDGDKKALIKRFEEFKESVKDIDVELYLGAEIMYTRGFTKNLFKENVVSLNNTNILLIEFPFANIGISIREALYDVMCLGYKVVLAHPERYLYLSFDEIKMMKKDGVIMQVNTTSLDGGEGFKIRCRARKMARLGLIDFVASDCHGVSGKRKPNLSSKYLKYIKNKIDLF